MSATTETTETVDLAAAVLELQRRARIERQAAELAAHAVLAFQGDLSYWPRDERERQKIAGRFVADVVYAALDPRAHPWAVTTEELLSTALLGDVRTRSRRAGVDCDKAGLGAVNCYPDEWSSVAAVAFLVAVEALAASHCLPCDWEVKRPIPAGELRVKGGAR